MISDSDDYGVLKPKVKIGIIGGGTASAVTILSLMAHVLKKYGLNYSRLIQIECIHNPDIPITAVGEGASAALPMLLKNVLNYDHSNIDELKKIDATVRRGTRHFWEDNLGKEFEILYAYPAMHVNSAKTSKFIIEEMSKKYTKNFFEHYDNVLSINQDELSVTVIGEKKSYNFDYLFDCSGSPNEKELNGKNYSLFDFQTVNSALIFPDFKEYNEPYTSVMFHKNGWMFGIPLQHRKAFGYLYNKDITNKKEALEHFKTLKPELKEEELIYFSWKSYYRKKAMEGRIIYTGNKNYFFEPALGLPLHYYITLANEFIIALFNPFYSDSNIEEYINLVHSMTVKKIQDLISLYYSGKNKMDSPFWNITRKKTISSLKNSKSFKDFSHFKINKKFTKRYWTMDEPLMIDYLNGLDIDLEEIIT